MRDRRKRQRSLAAKRGWETRRRRAAEAEERRRRRSLAAKRGWETRREMAMQRELEERELRALEREAFEREAAEPDADMSDEWEIGFEYRGAGYGGRHHAVDVNIRLRRADGAPFGAREAAAALKEFHNRLSRADRNPIPPGYELAAIDWRRPRSGSGWRGGDDDVGPLLDFNSPMYVEKDNPLAWSLTPGFRLGGVKD